jgi:hypothetical protein
MTIPDVLPDRITILLEALNCATARIISSNLESEPAANCLGVVVVFDPVP